MPDLTLAYAWTDARGKRHKADSTVTVDRPTASELLASGLARPAAEAPTKAPAGAPKD